jgi:CYTH domain-containing protein
VNTSGVEIERKWLLAAAPSGETLERLGARPKRIEQIYLRGTGGDSARRIRSIEEAGVRTLVLTEKRVLRRAVSGGRADVREELERELTPAEYDDLLLDADPDRRPIRKTRYVFPYDGHVLELDVFEQPRGLVVLEIELEDEDDRPALPPELEVIREVSDDSAYLNWNLARRAADEG